MELLPEKQVTGHCDQSVNADTLQDLGHGKVQFLMVGGLSSPGHLKEKSRELQKWQPKAITLFAHKQKAVV